MGSRMLVCVLFALFMRAYADCTCSDGNRKITVKCSALRMENYFAITNEGIPYLRELRGLSALCTAPHYYDESGHDEECKRISCSWGQAILFCHRSRGYDSMMRCDDAATLAEKITECCSQRGVAYRGEAWYHDRVDKQVVKVKPHFC